MVSRLLPFLLGHLPLLALHHLGEPFLALCWLVRIDFPFPPFRLRASVWSADHVDFPLPLDIPIGFRDLSDDGPAPSGIRSRFAIALIIGCSSVNILG